MNKVLNVISYEVKVKKKVYHFDSDDYEGAEDLFFLEKEKGNEPVFKAVTDLEN